MNEMPLVSIVMPSLNQAQFIGAAIESVLNQDYSNLELIIADGGSDDDTHALLAQKQKEDARLNWFSGKDTGPANAINKALMKVRGTLIGWLNSDDLYTQGAVSRVVDAFTNHKEWIMIYGQGEHIDANGNRLDLYPTLLPATPIERFADGCFICQPTVFFRRTQFILLGQLDEDLKTSFDFEYWLRAFRQLSGRIGFVDALQAQSRLHDACITRSMRRKVALEGIQVLHRHFGHAPIHWALTYINELIMQQNVLESTTLLNDQIESFIGEASCYLNDSELHRLRQELLKNAILEK